MKGRGLGLVIYKTQYRFNHQRACNKCGVPFRDGDELWVTSTRKKYHQKCWEAMQI